MALIINIYKFQKTYSSLLLAKNINDVILSFFIRISPLLVVLFNIKDNEQSKLRGAKMSHLFILPDDEQKLLTTFSNFSLLGLSTTKPH